MGCIQYNQVISICHFTGSLRLKHLRRRISRIPLFPGLAFFSPPMHIRQVSVHLSEIAEKRKEKSSASVVFVHINRSAAQNSSFLFHSETVPKTQLEKL